MNNHDFISAKDVKIYNVVLFVFIGQHWENFADFSTHKNEGLNKGVSE